MKRLANRIWRDWLRPFALVFIIAAPFKSAVADWNWVPTGSMKPSILEGELVFVNKLAYDLKVPFTTVHLSTWGNPVRGDVLTGADVAQVCRSLKVDVLLVNARDPVWNNPDSWVWKTKPSIQNDFVRIYQCGSGL